MKEGEIFPDRSLWADRPALDWGAEPRWGMGSRWAELGHFMGDWEKRPRPQLDAHKGDVDPGGTGTGTPTSGVWGGPGEPNEMPQCPLWSRRSLETSAGG